MRWIPVVQLYSRQAVNDSRIVELAKGGDTEAARILIRFIAEDLSQKKSLSPPVAAYLAECLQQMVDGVDASTALNLGKSEEDPNNAHKDIEIAMDYWKLRVSGESASTARSIVAQSWGISEALIKQISADFRKSVMEILDLRKRIKAVTRQKSGLSATNITRFPG